VPFHPVTWLVGEVRQVGLLRVGIPLAGEDASATLSLEARSDAADSGKQINEGKGVVFIDRAGNQRQDPLPDGIGPVGGNVFVDLPATEGALIDLENGGQLLDGVTRAGEFEDLERGWRVHRRRWDRLRA